MDDKKINKPFTWDYSEDDEPDEFEIEYVDINNKPALQKVKTVDDLSVGSAPVNADDLRKLTNLERIKLVSKLADMKKPYEKTGQNRTGRINRQSFIEETRNINLGMGNGVSSNELITEQSPIILNEVNTEHQALSGKTNNN